MSVSLSREEIIKKSLARYFETLTKLSMQEELVELTKTDLKNEILILLEVQSQVEIKTQNPQSYLSSPNNPKYNRVIHSALHSYREALEASIENITSLSNANIPLILTNADLQLVNEALEKISE
jgi:hypothetical protein